MATKIRVLSKEEREEAMEAQGDSQRRQKINLTLHPDTILLARKFGEGNVSRGIDMAIMYYHERTTAMRRVARK